jgi:UDP-N-acetylmuramoyl-tripeptide--D-alanyl-D-alanine ligase
MVAGDMLELGSEEAALHSQTAALLAGSAVDLAIFVGNQAERCLAAAAAAGFPDPQLRAFRDVAALSSALPKLLQRGDVVLVKGSRALQLERMLNWLQQQNGLAVSFHDELHRDTGSDH